MADENKKQVEAKKAEEKAKKTFAIVNGRDLRISPKYSFAICRMIRGKKIDYAIKMLEEVIAFKRVVKTNNMEIPHKHGKGIMAGGYPVKACGEFIRLLKQLNANAIVNELDNEKCVIFCKADIASRPYRSGGRRFKATHVLLRFEEEKKQKGKKKQEKK